MKNIIVCDKDNGELRKLSHFVKSKENWKLYQIGYNEINQIKDSLEGYIDEEDESEDKKF